MSLPGGTHAGADDKGPTSLPPRPGKAARVLLFFGDFFGFSVGIPALTVAVMQAKYGLIDGPPSFLPDALGEQIKSITKFGIFVWAGGEPAVAGVSPITRELLMQRLAGTSRGDKPYTISADHSLFVWSTRNQCGDEFLTEQDESKPERFCLAQLPKPAGSR